MTDINHGRKNRARAADTVIMAGDPRRGDNEFRRPSALNIGPGRLKPDAGRHRPIAVTDAVCK